MFLLMGCGRYHIMLEIQNGDKANPMIYERTNINSFILVVGAHLVFLIKLKTIREQKVILQQKVVSAKL